MMYLITFFASNNDTYESREMSLFHCINTEEEQEELNPEELEYTMFFDELPTKKEITNKVQGTYDGVWEPDMKSIRVFSVEELNVL